MTTRNETLDRVERRGTLVYMIGLEVRRMSGNFRVSMDNRLVEARKLRGRNRFALCQLDQMVDFIPAQHN